MMLWYLIAAGIMLIPITNIVVRVFISQSKEIYENKEYLRLGLLCTAAPILILISTALWPMVVGTWVFGRIAHFSHRRD